MSPTTPDLPDDGAYSDSMRGALLAVALVGCGAAQVRVAPEDVTRAEVLPIGYELIGRVVASCHGLDGFEATEGEPLASFDCKRERLERVLAEQASEAGGNLLVAPSCGRDGRTLRCTATAARPEDTRAVSTARPLTPDQGPVPGPRAIERWDEPRASASLVIVVDFEPSVATFARASRSASDVAEDRALPVSHFELGTLTTRCDEDDCELTELKQALRIAAGGLGGSDLVSVRCATRRGERECLATLAAPEVVE
jgi:hypothetical protein